MTEREERLATLKEKAAFRMWFIAKIVQLVHDMLPYALGVVALVCVTRSIGYLSGKETSSEFFIKIITDLKMNQWFGYVFGLSGTTYGLQQRGLRRKEIARLAPRADVLEKQIDPRKESSYLSSTGTTPVWSRREK